jgi:hypothetical protein
MNEKVMRLGSIAVIGMLAMIVQRRKNGGIE